MFKTNPKTDPVLPIIIASIVGLLSFFSMTITIFAYGNGDTTLLYLLRYPVLFVSTILTITKVRFGFLLTLLTVFAYFILLTSETGKYFILTFRSCCLCRVNIEFKKVAPRAAFAI